MKRWLVVSTVVGLALAGSSASGGLVLDQYQEAGQFMVPIWYGREVAQTFTAGTSGRLDYLELAVVPWHPQLDILVEIRDTLASAPGDTLLGGVVASVPEATVWTSIDLRSQNIFLTAGEMYSIVLPLNAWGLSQAECYLYGQVESGTGPYSAGAQWERVRYSSYDYWRLYEDSRFDPVATGDLRFRTYVETGAVVPVPGAGLLAGLGLATVGWLNRRRAL